MIPIITDTTNRISTAEGCLDLPNTKTSDGEHYETCWKLTDEELKKVHETGKIYILINADHVHPMLVDVETMLMTEGDSDGCEQ